MSIPMTMKTKLLPASAAALIAATPAFAPAMAQSIPERIGVNQALGVAPSTEDFVTIAAQSDMLEIEASKLALQKSDSDKTRKFAERMIKDHTETSTGLKALVSGGKLQADAPTALDKTHQEKLDRLARMQGKEFTEHYNDLQLAGHKDAVSLFDRYNKEGDNADLKAFAAKHLTALKQHLEMAKELDK